MSRAQTPSVARAVRDVRDCCARLSIRRVCQTVAQAMLSFTAIVRSHEFELIHISLIVISPVLGGESGGRWRGILPFGLAEVAEQAVEVIRLRKHAVPTRPSAFCWRALHFRPELDDVANGIFTREMFIFLP